MNLVQKSDNGAHHGGAAPRSGTASGLRAAPFAALAAALVLAAATPAAAAPIDFVAQLMPLNNSGVTATYNLTLDGTMLTVTGQGSGLEPNMPHPAHIHGLIGANAAMTAVPTLANDTDGDGFIELDEGLITYGPIIVPLSSPPGGALADFPTAPGGSFNFSETYDLTDPSVFAGGFSITDLLALDNREIVLHGLTVAEGVGAGTPGEVNGTGGYSAVLPVAAGLIQVAAVPEPMSMALLAVGVAGTLAASRRRQRRAG